MYNYYQWTDPPPPLLSHKSISTNHKETNKQAITCLTLNLRRGNGGDRDPSRRGNALRWAAMRAIFEVSLIVTGNHVTVSTDHNF